MRSDITPKHYGKIRPETVSNKGRIGVGFSKFDVDIRAEYEKYKKSAPNPISYETFANTCGPYWDADLEADIRAKRDELYEKEMNYMRM